MLLVADNLQITNLVIEKAVKDLNPVPIQEMVKKCQAAGADAIDINSGPLSRDPEKKMAFMVESVQEVTNLPLLLDTTNPKALEAGLKMSKNKTIINGFSLEPAKLEFILPLAKKYNTRIIGYLLYPNSHVPNDESQRLNIAVELYEEFQKSGMDNEQLIIDPVIAPVMWENGNIQDMEILSVIRNLPDLLGFPVKTIAGISNLTTGAGPKDKKLLLERAYVPMLAAAGLDMALMNIFHSDTIKTAKACNALYSKHIFTWAEI
ncbi:Pterin-binding domain-containing protein [Desulfonema limicola]|uniref:Pterin-binding domain-containing protein n=1 Tax=Desulfonema limicola TaxID=45656 RepID=A0A975GK97_9BACT|nr:dihydropteroate synthase [Desulfonema limicola]QTA83593.1 Pterin-binding domain-containing protein [Desulfonema limicola]